MRTLKITLMVAMALALGASTASASSVDVIWLISGTATTTVASSSSVTGNVTMSIGISDTALGGFGAGYELSGLYSSPGLAVTGSTNSAPGGAPLPTGPDDLAGLFENMFAASYFGPAVGAGATITIGTVTVHAGAGGTINVGLNGAFGDDILNPGATSIASEFSFNSGIVNVPEPTTASLLGLGLMGLTVAGRRRKS